MKMTIRRGVFETNSSSVHNFTMVSGEEYEKFENGELYIHRSDLHFLTKEQYVEENKKWLSEEKIEEILKCEDDNELYDLTDGDLCTYGLFWDGAEGDFETFEETYKTKNGDEVVTFGYYGYDS